MKILFLFENKDEDKWRDGLWQALNRLQERGHEVEKRNLATLTNTHLSTDDSKFDIILGWGGFGSKVDQVLTTEWKSWKKGLCIGGVAMPPESMNEYDVLFYETEWYRPTINLHKNIHHAFGINEEIFNSEEAEEVKFWDWVTVGAFADWKRQKLLINKEGRKIAVGDIQRNNLAESMDIVGDLMMNGVAVMDMQNQEFVADLFRNTNNVYLPASVVGGGERALLEARACGANVVIEPDNPKLSELLAAPIWDSNYYADQLEKGLQSVK